MCSDANLKYIPGDGSAVATFDIAVKKKNKKEGQAEADFIPIVIWGKKAEATATHMRKGRMISIAGRMSTRNYETKDGNKKNITEVIADEVDFIDWGGNKKENSTASDTSKFGKDITPIDDGDVPF